MERLRSLERGLASAEKLLLAALLAVMVALSFLQVVLRGAFSAGLLWADTFLRHLVLWAGFLGAAAAAAEGKQFAMDAALRALGGNARRAVEGLSHAVCASVCALLGRASWRFLADEYASGGILFSVGSLHVPGWLFETILPAGFALLGIHYLIKLALAVGGHVDEPTGSRDPAELVEEDPAP